MRGLAWLGRLTGAQAAARTGLKATPTGRPVGDAEPDGLACCWGWGWGVKREEEGVKEKSCPKERKGKGKGKGATPPSQTKLNLESSGGSERRERDF